MRREMPTSMHIAGCMLAAVLGVACSKDAEPGSCYRPGDNACVEYGRAEAAAGKRLCSGMTWTEGEKSCPSADRVGTCVKPSGQEHLHAGPPNNYNAASARTACEFAGGVFTAAR